MGRVVGIDHGSARCGVAITDPSRTIVSPKPPIARPDSDEGFAELVSLVRQNEAEGVVVGLPLGLTGGDTDQTTVARNFAARLASGIAPAWVELLDERFTTQEAKEVGGMAAEDSRAAAVLLERWLERNSD